MGDEMVIHFATSDVDTFGVVVPEPGSLLFLLFGGLCLGARRRRGSM
jgi:hypothetical protein